jgi:hypothetical protein
MLAPAPRRGRRTRLTAVVRRLLLRSIGVASYMQRLFRAHRSGSGRCILSVVNIQEIRPEEQQRLRQLLQAGGREPGSFRVAIQPDGLVRVSGPRGTAFYPRETWLTRFARHLDKSFFDPAVPAPAGPRLERKPAAAMGSPA